MYDSNSKGISYIAGFCMLIAFAIAGLMLAGIISIPIFTGMTGQKFEAFKDGMTNPAYSNAYKVIQSVTSVFSYFIPAVFTAWLLNKRPYKLLGFSPEVKFSQAGMTVLIMLIALLISTSLAYFNEIIPVPADWKVSFDKLEADYIKQVEVIVGLNNFSEYIIALIVMAFLPAVCEETLFRGGLQNFLTRSTKNYWLSIIIVSIIFSAAHFSYYGFLSRLFLGIVLGLLFQYSGKLWLSITAHFLNNALAISALYYFKQQGKSISEATKETNASWMGIFALPLLIGLFIYFRKISRTETNTEQ
ncbi:MAG TPA: CPBP family intramembrane glutamic endopeptidase [Chitinophagaceae bacterium]